MKIDKQIFKQRLAKMTAGEFDMVAAGWGPDYDDPLTFGDLFSSWNKNNRGLYSNPELDRLRAHRAEFARSEDAHGRIRRDPEDHSRRRRDHARVTNAGSSTCAMRA